MPISTVLSNATTGLRTEARRTEAAANNIANANTPGYLSQTGTNRPAYQTGHSGPGNVEAQVIAGKEPVSLVRETATLIKAKTAYAANGKLVQTAEELAERTLDILA